MGSIPSTLRKRRKKSGPENSSNDQSNEELSEKDLRRNEDNESVLEDQAENESENGIEHNNDENDENEEEEEENEEENEEEENEEEENEEEQDEEEKEQDEEEREEEQEELEEQNGGAEEKANESEMEGDGDPEEEYTAWGGEKVKVEYSGTKLKALRGNMHIEYPEETQIVRIFTSSTFTDTSVERNTLMESVYPKLKIFCQKKGFEFQVVDMRWGVRDEATDDHMTTELCMKELYACQKLSTGPNFITFLGQKYGYRPFPPKIEESEFQQLLKAAENSEDRATLERWFKLDTNAIPKEYILQPITSILPNYRNQSNPELRKAASGDWWSCFERMQMALRKAAIKVLGKDKQQKYVMSVTEDEIRRGVITAASPEKHCFWFKRVISDLNKNIGDKKVGSFIDKVWGKDTVDEEAQQYLKTLREADLPNVLPEKNINVYNVKWSAQGIDPKQEQSHDRYIKNLCQDFYSVLTTMIENGISEKQSEESNNEEIFDEMFQHGIFCQKKCKSFHGRKPFLENIKQEIENGSTTFILQGQSGCGKTSVMAKLASSVKKWIGDPKATLVLRFIGTTANSFAIRDLLKSICVQLYKATGHQMEEIPEDLKSLKEYLNTCLELAADKHPVILMLDSLDQLSGDDGGLQLEWLPTTLPSDVYLILSTLPEEKYICLPKLKMHFPEEAFKAIPKMNKEEAADILDNWLKDAARSLTSQQRQSVLHAFHKCPLPLFLKLAFDEACRWKSYTPENETKLPLTIREVIHSLFDRLERIHGKRLVSHALAYISGSKNGLTQSELEDLLSLDDDVLNDVYQYWTPPVRRLPPLIWLRVRSDLGDYLAERGSDGARVSFWYHRQFIEVSHERYLQNQGSVKFHSNMAEYFQGTWSDGKKKPFVNKKGEHLEMDRLVAQQPLVYDANEDSVVFNKRKLTELPYHLIKSKKLNELKETVLCNYYFLLEKLRGMSCDLVMDDFRMAVNGFPEDDELKLLYETIGLSVNALKLEPRQLPSQLIGRLFDMQDDASASDTHPFISKLLKQLRSSPFPYFVPHSKCLTSSGGPLIHAISEHDESLIDSICLACDNSTVVTTVRGNEGLEIRIFNVRAGLLERKLILTEPVPEVFLIWHAIMSRRDKQKLVMIGGRHILVLDLKSGEMVHQIEAMSEDHAFNQSGYEIPPVALGNSDTRVVALTDKGIKIWNIETGKLEHEVPVNNVDTSGRIGALDASKEYVAYSKKESTDVTVISIHNGKVIQTMKSSVEKSSGSYVKFIKLTDEGKLLIMSSNSTELNVFDAASGKLVKNVVGFNANTTIKELIITTDGKKLICQDKFDLAIWDMETWKCRKVLNDMAHMHSANVKTNDGKTVVHANITDRILRIYDASKDEGKETTVDASSTDQWVLSQINSLYRSCDNRHFITTGTANMASEISIWDVNQGKQVRVFKSLMFYPNVLRMVSSTLAVGYIYNEKMHHYVVLDFAAGKVVRQLEGKACNRMYMMEVLDEDRMVSFTRGRRHLKVWNIQSGKVIQQIKLGQKHRLEAFLLSGNKKIMVIAQVGPYSGEIKDKTIPLIVYDFSTGKQHEIREDEEQLKFDSVGVSINGSISYSGRYMVNVNNYTSAVFWDVSAGKKLHSLSSEQLLGAIYSSEIIEEKNIFLTSVAGSTNKVIMWDITSGECVREIITVTAVNELKISVDQRLVFWKDMQGPNFFVHELESGKDLAAFTSDQPIAPQAFNVINDHVVIGTTGSIDPIIFRLCRGDESKSEDVDSSVFEDGTDVIKSFAYDGKTLPPDPRDVDNDKDDDKGQAC